MVANPKRHCHKEWRTFDFSCGWSGLTCSHLKDYIAVQPTPTFEKIHNMLWVASAKSFIGPTLLWLWTPLCGRVLHWSCLTLQSLCIAFYFALCKFVVYILSWWCIAIWKSSACRSWRWAHIYFVQILYFFMEFKGSSTKKMPKIDTLDALDDEMTSILNTLCNTL